MVLRNSITISDSFLIMSGRQRKKSKTTDPDKSNGHEAVLKALTHLI